jgi:hypothetical protein
LWKAVEAVDYRASASLAIRDNSPQLISFTGAKSPKIAYGIACRKLIGAAWMCT